MQPDDYDLTGFKPATHQTEGTAVPYNRHGFPMANPLDERFRFPLADWRGIFGTIAARHQSPALPPALIDFDPEKPLPISLQ